MTITTTSTTAWPPALTSRSAAVVDDLFGLKSMSSAPDVRETIELWRLRNNRTRLLAMLNSSREEDLVVVRAQRLVIENQTRLINFLYATVLTFVLILVLVCSLVTYVLLVRRRSSSSSVRILRPPSESTTASASTCLSTDTTAASSSTDASQPMLGLVYV